MGFLVSLAALYGLFNLNNSKATVPVIKSEEVEVTEEILPITFPEETPQPKTTKVVAPTISEKIEVVENTFDIANDDIFNTETDENTPVYYGITTGIPQEGDLIITEDAPLIKAEIDPDFQGAGKESSSKFRTWVQMNVRYPQLAQDNGVSGAVNLKFVIGTDGRIKDITVLSSPDRSLTEEVIRVLNASPIWTPGQQRGKPVSVYGTIKIVFTL